MVEVLVRAWPRNLLSPYMAASGHLLSFANDRCWVGYRRSRPAASRSCCRISGCSSSARRQWAYQARSAMRNLYALQPSNSHPALLARDVVAWQRATSGLNRTRLTDEWQALELEFQQLDQHAAGLPDICTIYITGALALRADLLGALMPDQTGLELLPLGVGSQPWLLVNCLNAVDRYDEVQSNVMRDHAGNAFLVLNLVISESEAVPELFTLTNSNRAQLFTTESFKARVERMGLQGIAFQPMGISRSL